MGSKRVKLPHHFYVFCEMKWLKLSKGQNGYFLKWPFFLSDLWHPLLSKENDSKSTALKKCVQQPFGHVSTIWIDGESLGWWHFSRKCSYLLELGFDHKIIIILNYNYYAKYISAFLLHYHSSKIRGLCLMKLSSEML